MRMDVPIAIFRSESLAIQVRFLFVHMTKAWRIKSFSKFASFLHLETASTHVGKSKLILGGTDVYYLFTKNLYYLFYRVFCMSDVIAVRIPKKLKDELQELNLDYAEDVRAHLEKMVKKEKLKKKLEEVQKFRNELGRKTGLTASSADTIRGDRECAH